ncbi:hypothetical protein CTI12_AA116420 [Artemisia annua]|uniref:Uncharacterized protein n=1 Tax=Artemisia annua TaxID=35608 RepID=A0A2U1PSN7_ARTAN|nr:hypothetical protein CTI12_AA116420 [Artemisia annua]
MRISRMKMTMLILLSLCLIANVSASSNGDDYFVFDKAERAVGYKPVGGGIGASHGNSGIIRGTSGVGTSKTPSVGGGRFFLWSSMHHLLCITFIRSRLMGVATYTRLLYPFTLTFLGIFVTLSGL